MSPRAPDRHPEQGAALLTVLLIVAALAAIAVVILEDMRRAVRLESNAQSLTQAQWYAIGASQYARVAAQAFREVEEGRLAFLNGPVEVTYPLDHGLLRMRLSDATTCINVNGVVQGAGDLFQSSETGRSQLLALLGEIGAPARQAQEVVQSISAWIDTGEALSGSNADDTPYLAQSPPYMTGGEPLADISELRAIRGVTPDLYDRMLPHACALPALGPSRVNVNALTPDKGLVLSAVTLGQLTPAAATAMIEARPPTGWPSVADFWAQPQFAGLQIDPAAMEAVMATPRFIRLSVEVDHLDAQVTMTELLMFNGTGYAAITRKWTADR